MKTPLFAIAAVGIAAGAVLSYQQIDKHQAELDKAQDLTKKAATLNAEVAKSQREYDGMPEKTDVVKAELDVLMADLERQELEKNSLESKVKQLSAQVETQEQDLKESEEIIAKFEEAFKEQNIPVSGIGDYISQLNEERDGLMAELEEKLALSEESQVKLDTQQAALTDYKKREVERARNLSQNSISSLITAVSADWGFVVIKPSAGAVITADSQLMIVRGAQHIGRVKISAIEPGRVIANIDNDSLVAGARVRAGDRVILAKAATN